MRSIAQRKHQRVAWRLPVSVEVDGGETIEAVTLDISAGGLCLRPGRPLARGAHVVVVLRLADSLRQRTLRLPAKVVRDATSTGASGSVALQLVEPSPGERAFLRACVLQRALVVVESLAEYPAFRGLSDLDMLDLASVSHELTLDAGEHAARFGDEATSVFLVKSGTVELRAPDLEQGVPVELAHAGQIFGEAAALLGLPHNLDVVAIEPTELLVIPRAALGYLRDHNPKLALVLYEVFAAFMGRRVRRLTGRLVSPLSY